MAPSPILHLVFVNRIATTLATSSEARALLFEQHPGVPSPLLIPSDEKLESLLRGDAERIGGHLETVAPIPPLRIARTPRSFYGILRPLSGSARSSPLNGRESASPSPLPVETTDSAVSLLTQVHWVGHGDGRVRVAARYVIETEPIGGNLDPRPVAAALSNAWTGFLGFPVTAEERRLTQGARTDLIRAGWKSVRPTDWFLLSAAQASGLAALSVVDWEPFDGHSVIFGSSGSGKTTYLARECAKTALRGSPVLAFDVHGDLGPAIAARLETGAAKERLFALDPSREGSPGIAVLGAEGRSERAREATHVVAALRRLSHDGTETYWGFRLERIFDTFVRVVQEEGGSLLDLYQLLVDERRREAARLATRSADAARFLGELPGILRRNPEFLWAAASRLSKLVLSERLGALVAPERPSFPCVNLLTEGSTIVVRIPFAEFGPEASSLAASLLLGRIYQGIQAAVETGSRPLPILLVVDEAQAFAPRLLAEILSDGRKFGLRVLLATQFPDRLTPELRAAAAGAAATHRVFRTPRASAVTTGRWLGMQAPMAEQLLTALPTGWSLVADPGAPLRYHRTQTEQSLPDSHAPWQQAFDRTRSLFSAGLTSNEHWESTDPIAEDLLFALLCAQEQQRAVDAAQVIREVLARAEAAWDPAAVSDRLSTLVRRGWIDQSEPCLRLTAVGERFLGLNPDTGATRESAEHRHLLLIAFRIFARNGGRLTILRQGRFDTRLPDAVFRLLPTEARGRAPRDLEIFLDRAKGGWAWRFFGGRDVYVEAEVSGAERPDRIRRGLAKARGAGAFALFLVSDARRAARVRSVLVQERLFPRSAQVWTIVAAQATRAKDRQRSVAGDSWD